MPQLKITITRDGKVKRETTGFKGESCLTRTSFLDSVLGEPVQQVLKDSYYQEEEVVKNGLPSGWCG